ncbi:MAG TPA: enoyl-CoA hydratase/isomerase family protein [Polaromonas sp.]|uniref:enoyl-CoA hydratase/isomerase family protein n=1 Tax=Polaromonas sp. TaxID=1869339 RepID=UPI002D51E0C3|nr:enoyl-CoA hydratase/isomerase family protein [Polaromonas sp.]HYW58054.1 enoyl-CoA hydratase/isomerase family protein [Polaromonas sp.]
MSGKVLLATDGPIARVTLSHPGKLNAMSRAMWRALRDVFASLQGRADVRCVVVTGEGGAFCAGGDISEYPDFRFDEKTLRDFHENEVWAGLQSMLDCDIPVIAQIEGNCMGAGVEVACCADFRFASASAKFGAPIAKLGFPMAPREAALVCRVAGELTAREMLLAATVLDPATMLQRGFLNRVVEDAALHALVVETAARIVQLAPQAARMNKQSFRAFAQEGRAVAAINSIAKPYAYASSAEHREGVMAFVEKRAPHFAR